jgi:hypothetical protein
MGYSSNDGKRPFELASKSSHHHIINDPDVQALLGNLTQPPKPEEIPLEQIAITVEELKENPVQGIVAVDGGYAETTISKDYPSRLIHFLQFGALFFRRQDLELVEASTFILPEDMSRLKSIHRLKMALPTRNVRLQSATSMQDSVLQTIYTFFRTNTLGEQNSLLDTLAWLVFRHYKGPARSEQERTWDLATNPRSPHGNPVVLVEDDMRDDYTFACPETGDAIYLTDVFRLHEAIDEERGATGILGYLVNVVEHLVLVHIIRHILRGQPSALRSVLFIKDGPAGFFGQTARMYALMGDLVAWLFQNHSLLLAGIEKSGAFVDHANDIRGRLEPGTAVILTNDYIYRYILPPPSDPSRPYGCTTNYGHKVVYKSRLGHMYVISLPVTTLKVSPTAEDIPQLNVVLGNVEALRCDLYESALFPVALVNKLVSLSAHPSQQILQRFAIGAVVG